MQLITSLGVLFWKIMGAFESLSRHRGVILTYTIQFLGGSGQSPHRRSAFAAVLCRHGLLGTWVRSLNDTAAKFGQSVKTDMIVSTPIVRRCHEQ
jgi:hypothetical protein